MPYIKDYEKKEFLAGIDVIKNNVNFNGITPGELNYTITELCKLYIEYKGKNYTHLNDVVGVLESAKLEFYRRMVSNYEDEKKEINGDVY